MKLNSLVPVIQCEHLEETLEFYQQAFRYVPVQQQSKDGALKWVYLKSDSTFLMLQCTDKSGTNKAISDSIILHYYTNDITTLHQYIRARGYTTGSIQQTAYGMKQFYINDPEGNTISVGEQVLGNQA